MRGKSANTINTVLEISSSWNVATIGPNQGVLWKQQLEHSLTSNGHGKPLFSVVKYQEKVATDSCMSLGLVLSLSWAVMVIHAYKHADRTRAHSLSVSCSLIRCWSLVYPIDTFSL
jgi:hypothetical protein